VQNEKYTGRTWIMARKQKNMENETKHCVTWNMVKNTEKHEKLETNPVGPGIM
jgi:hypothetical protein